MVGCSVTTPVPEFGTLLGTGAGRSEGQEGYVISGGPP